MESKFAPSKGPYGTLQEHIFSSGFRSYVTDPILNKRDKFHSIFHVNHNVFLTQEERQRNCCADIRRFTSLEVLNYELRITDGIFWILISFPYIFVLYCSTSAGP